MLQPESDESYEVIWDTIPYPAFVISKSNLIVTANSAAETYCLSSIRHIKNKPVANHAQNY